MAVKIRLKRRGRKKLAMFDVVVADSRSPRDGKFIERIGTYNPNTNPATIELNEDKAFDWVMKGAQPTDTVRAMLSYRGILLKKHLQIGVLKGAISQEDADKKFDTWLKQKETAIESKRTGLAEEEDKKRKDRIAAEKKVNEARAEALRKRKEEEVEALKEEITQDAGEAEMAEEAEEASANTEAPATPEQEKVEEKASEDVKKEEPKEEKKEETKDDAPAKEEKKEEAKAESPSKEENKEDAKAESPAKEEKKEEAKAEAPADKDKKEDAKEDKKD